MAFCCVNLHAFDYKIDLFFGSALPVCISAFVNCQFPSLASFRLAVWLCFLLIHQSYLNIKYIRFRGKAVPRTCMENILAEELRNHWSLSCLWGRGPAGRGCAGRPPVPTARSLIQPSPSRCGTRGQPARVGLVELARPAAHVALAGGHQDGTLGRAGLCRVARPFWVWTPQPFPGPCTLGWEGPPAAASPAPPPPPSPPILMWHLPLALITEPRVGHLLPAGHCVAQEVTGASPRICVPCVFPVYEPRTFPWLAWLFGLALPGPAGHCPLSVEVLASSLSVVC